MTRPDAAPRFQHLDGLRGIFALSVALSHILGSIAGWVDSRPLIGAYLAVDYFFVLSGFVLTHMLGKQNFGPAKFFMKRLRRLWPLHFITTMMVFVIFWNNRLHGQYYIHDATLTLSTLADNLSFASGTGFTQVPMINNPAWSISVEFWVSGIMMYWLAKFKPRYLFPIAALAYAMVFSEGHGLMAAYSKVFYVPDVMLRGFAGMTFGCALYKIRAQLEAVAAKLSSNGMSLLLAASFVLIVRAFWVQAGQLYDVVPLIAIVPFFAIGRSGDLGGPVGKILSNIVLQWFGRISFPLYLVHTSVIVLGGPGSYAALWGTWPTALVFLGVSIIVAAGLERILAPRKTPMAPATATEKPSFV
jgi:peptidoglycan/LPS O-acetylase OafA/YrhL